MGGCAYKVYFDICYVMLRYDYVSFKVVLNFACCDTI
jgi:hypothetical protein